MSLQLSFTERITFQDSPGALVTLSLADYEVDMPVLIDTGAKLSLLDGVHARSAGLEIFQGRPRAFQGFLGARTVAYQHPARLRLGSLRLDCELAFSTQPLLRQVLGLDVLQHLRFGLDQRAREMFLATRPG